MKTISKPYKLAFIFCSQISFGFVENVEQVLELGEQYFNEIAQEPNNLYETKKLFWEILRSNTNLVSKALAVDRIGRLSIIEIKHKKKLFILDVLQECLMATEHIKPTKIGRHVPEYYFWRATCMVLGADHNEEGYSLKFSINALELIISGLQKYPAYEGQGFARLKSEVIERYLCHVSCGESVKWRLASLKSIERFILILAASEMLTNYRASPHEVFGRAMSRINRLEDKNSQYFLKNILEKIHKDILLEYYAKN